MEEVRAKKEKAEKAVIEKIAIAEQTLELVESFIRKLDADLGSFEVLLRGGGEFESMGAEPGQEVKRFVTADGVNPVPSHSCVV